MPLLDPDNDRSRTDNVEKSRLFDTLNDEDRSARDYLKVLLPVVLAIIVISLVVIYFTVPGAGDEVRPPDGLDEAIKTYYRENEKRDVSGVVYFYCEGSHTARVSLEQRPDITAREFDHGNRRAVAIRNTDGTWQLSSKTVEPNETFVPCQ
ncbi:MAG: hypothetical protein AB7F88_17965 [Pyrinomonadaceae bacterium]